MQEIIKKKIGKNVYTFVVEGKNLHECVMQSQKLSFNDVSTCGICNSNNLILLARKAQEKFKYTMVNCLDCKAQLVFGTQTEDPDVFYLRKDDKKKFAWKKFDSQNTN